MNKSRIVIGLAVALSALLAFTLWRTAWMREEQDQGYSMAAREDDLLAARMYLARQGVVGRTVEVQGAGLALPADDGALVFLASRLALSDSSTARLRHWVVSGGHLITLSNTRADALLFGREDGLLVELGIATIEPKSAVPPRDAPYSYDDRGCIVDPIAWATLSTPSEQLAFSMPTANRLAARPRPRSRDVVVRLAHDKDGDLILSARYGQGRVTVLADGGLWFNADVGCLDHARLLQRLIGSARNVVLVAYADRPTLFDLLQRHGLLLLAAATVLLVLWLWHAGARYGSVLPSPAPVRRQRAEALRAAGEYLWRYRAVADLLAGVRQRVRRSARLRLGREDAIDVLAKRAAVSPDAAHAAMNADPRHERDLIAATRTLKDLIDQA